jgi:rare lipoprotein A
MFDTLVKRPAMLLMVWTVSAGVVAITACARAAESSAPQEAAASQQADSPAKPKPDLSGFKRVGKASFYADKLAGRKMADGTPMDPHDDNAASKTLPLGTTAKVTNLETGQSAVVTIQDRGPYVKGRIVDLSPSTARKIGITRNEGVAKVEVVPITVPLPDGSVKPGAAAQDAKSR